MSELPSSEGLDPYPATDAPNPTTLSAAKSPISIEPATAVVSLMNPDQITSIRSSFCNQVHYFTSVGDAAEWLAEHPGAEAVPVAEAHRIGAELAARLLDRSQGDVSAADDCRRCC